MMLTEAMKERAKRIAINYPVTSCYVENLLEHFPPADVIKLLDAFCVCAAFPSVEEILAVAGEREHAR